MRHRSAAVVRDVEVPACRAEGELMVECVGRGPRSTKAALPRPPSFFPGCCFDCLRLVHGTRLVGSPHCTTPLSPLSYTRLSHTQDSHSELFSTQRNARQSPILHWVWISGCFKLRTSLSSAQNKFPNSVPPRTARPSPEFSTSLRRIPRRSCSRC